MTRLPLGVLDDRETSNFSRILDRAPQATNGFRRFPDVKCNFVRTDTHLTVRVFVLPQPFITRYLNSLSV